MKKLLVIVLFLFALCASYAQRFGVEIDQCFVTRYYASGNRTFMAYGDVYVETDPKEFVDLRVKVVTDPRIADFLVFKTTDTPQDCGEWRFVKDRSKAKFTIRFVKEWEDCTIYYTPHRDRAGWYIVFRH